MPPYGPPTSPPPNRIPSGPYHSYLIDCMYAYTYVWPKNGRPFWFYPTRLEHGEASGYRWDGRKWTFYGFDPEIIDYVACTPVPTLY